ADILPFRTLIKRDPVNPAVYYTVSHRVWKSGDGGASWLPLPIATTDGSAWPTNRSISAMSIAASRPEVMMVALPGTFVFRTIDGGQTWTRTVTGLPNRVATSIAIDPRDPSRAWISYPGLTAPNVYATTNGGGSWAPSSNGLPSFSAQVLLVDPT